MQRTRAANISVGLLTVGKLCNRVRRSCQPPVRRSEQRQAAGLVAGLPNGIIGVGMPVVAVLSLFIDIKSAASDVRFRG
jgi:hypothetical protein